MNRNGKIMIFSISFFQQLHKYYVVNKIEYFEVEKAGYRNR